MKLELHRLSVKSLEFGDKTGFKNGTLTVNKAELLELISEDSLLGKISMLILQCPARRLESCP